MCVVKWWVSIIYCFYVVVVSVVVISIIECCVIWGVVIEVNGFYCIVIYCIGGFGFINCEIG